MVGDVAVTLTFYWLCAREWRVVRALLEDRVVIVQGKPFREFRRQFTLWETLGQAGGAGPLPGAGVLAVSDVERVHGLSGQKPVVLAPLVHAPRHRIHPAASAQSCQLTLPGPRLRPGRMPGCPRWP